MLRVKEVNELLAFTDCKLHNSVVSQELEQVGCTEVFFGCPVDSHEGAVGAKVRIAATESLPQLLRGQFALHDFDQ
jgi:hypothetical protein